MQINSNLYRCQDNDFINNEVLLKNVESRYIIPALQNNENIEFVDFDFYDEESISIEATADQTVGVLGRLREICSTEAHNVTTIKKTNNISLKHLACVYEASTCTKNTSLRDANSIDFVFANIYDSSARQIEKFLYKGYSLTQQLNEIDGLNGFKDIAVTYDGTPALPINATDYTSLCEFFVAGIDQARVGNVSTGSEFSKTDIEVHVASDIVDKINCSIVANTAIGLWDRLLTGVLANVKVVVSEQISNEVFFINNKGYFGKHNDIAKMTNGHFEPHKDKAQWGIKLGTISVGAMTSTAPVVYAENVLDALVYKEISCLEKQLIMEKAKKHKNENVIKSIKNRIDLLVEYNAL